MPSAGPCSGLPALHGHLYVLNTWPSFECSNVSHLTELTFVFHCVSVQLSACLLILSLIHYGAKHGPSWLEHFKWLAVVSIAAGLPKIAFKALIGLRHLVGCSSASVCCPLSSELQSACAHVTRPQVQGNRKPEHWDVW